MTYNVFGGTLNLALSVYLSAENVVPKCAQLSHYFRLSALILVTVGYQLVLFSVTSVCLFVSNL